MTQDRFFLTCMLEMWLLDHHGLREDESLQDKLNKVLARNDPSFIDREFPTIMIGALKHLGLSIGETWVPKPEPEPEPEPIVRVGTAALILHEGRILMGRRKGSHGAGTWSLPGGHVNFGEEPADAVRREIMEETGLEVGVVDTFTPMPYVNTHFEEGKQYVTLYFLAEFIGGEPRVMEPHKCETWEWFKLDGQVFRVLFPNMTMAEVSALCPYLTVRDLVGNKQGSAL